MLLHTVKSVAHSHHQQLADNLCASEKWILYSFLFPFRQRHACVRCHCSTNSHRWTGDDVVLSATVRPPQHPAKAVLDTGAGATLTMNSNNHTSLDERVSMQVSGFDERLARGRYIVRSYIRQWDDGSVCPHLSRDLLSVGRMIVNQGYKLFLSPTKCELTTPEGFDIPLVFDSKFLLTFMNQHLPYPKTESVFYTRELSVLSLAELCRHSSNLVIHYGFILQWQSHCTTHDLI